MRRRVLLRISELVVVPGVLGFVSGPRLSKFPHDGVHPGTPWWSNWNLDPFLLIGLFFLGWLYVQGTRRLWKRAGPGRGVSRRQAGYFGAGLITLALALVSPVDPFSDELFSAHMTQHILLGIVAPLFFAISAPILPVLWAFPRSFRRSAGKLINQIPVVKTGWHFLSLPLVAWFLFEVVLWVWHTPYLYQVALRNEIIHEIEHLTMFISGFLFWWAIIPLPKKGKMSQAFILIFTTAMLSGFLGVFLLFSTEPWYPLYIETAPRWGLSALEDQQIAGALMWIPPGVIYLTIALVFLRKRILRDENASLQNNISPFSK